MKEGNAFMNFSLEILEMQYDLSASNMVLLEHPEDLGRRAQGDPGYSWRWRRVRSFGEQEGMQTGVLRQSDWGR